MMVGLVRKGGEGMEEAPSPSLWIPLRSSRFRADGGPENGKETNGKFTQHKWP